MCIRDSIQIMHDLTSAGKTIIVITHKLKEIKASSNTCTIIRRGQYVAGAVCAVLVGSTLCLLYTSRCV